MCVCLHQELEALRSQIQSQQAEISQLQTERTELLRRAEAKVTDNIPIIHDNDVNSKDPISNWESETIKHNKAIVNNL